MDYPEPTASVWADWYGSGQVKSGSTWKKIFKKDDPRNESTKKMEKNK